MIFRRLKFCSSSNNEVREFTIHPYFLRIQREISKYIISAFELITETQVQVH